MNTPRRREWRARLILTGDPVIDGANKAAMLRMLNASMTAYADAEREQQQTKAIEATPACAACLSGDIEHQTTPACLKTHTCWKNCGEDCCIGQGGGTNQ